MTDEKNGMELFVKMTLEAVKCLGNDPAAISRHIKSQMAKMPPEEAKPIENWLAMMLNAPIGSEEATKLN